jgi:hypothetical protein
MNDPASTNTAMIAANSMNPQMRNVHIAYFLTGNKPGYGGSMETEIPNKTGQLKKESIPGTRP